MEKELEKTKKMVIRKGKKKEDVPIIPFNKCVIALRSNSITQCIFRNDKEGKPDLFSEETILEGKLKIDKKTYDYKTNSRELFSFWFNDHYYPTMSM